VIGGTASTLPPALRAKRMVFFGDSITEGVATVSQSSNRLISDDATLSYAYACAARFDVEFGVVGFAGWGLTVSVASGANVPPFIDAWADQFDEQPRSLDPEPDYVVVMLGANDHLSGLPQPGHVRDAVAAWLPNARDAFVTSKIFIVVEFDGFDRGEVTDGFCAYQLAAGFDPGTYLIDLGQAAQYGIDSGFVTGTTPTSYDGLHPDAARSAILGGWLADAIRAALGD
jgi:lysophospholipase L1-like esterase